MIPGRQISELMIVDPGWKSDPVSFYRSITLTLESDQKAEMPVAGLTLPVTGAGRTLMVDRLPGEFRDRFAKSTSLKLALPGKEPFVSIAYEDASRAIDALMDCDKGLLKSWGIDFDAATKFKKGAQWLTKQNDVFRPSDYPTNSIRKASSGIVVIAFQITLDGNPSSCRVVGSSGDRDLDRTTCELLSKRAKFMPAIGPDGKPAESSAVEAITWIVMAKPRF